MYRNIHIPNVDVHAQDETCMQGRNQDFSWTGRKIKNVEFFFKVLQTMIKKNKIKIVCSKIWTPTRKQYTPLFNHLASLIIVNHFSTNYISNYLSSTRITCAINLVSYIHKKNPKISGKRLPLGPMYVRPCVYGV